MNSFTSLLTLAQAESTAPTAGPAQMMGGMGQMGQMLPLILIFAILYFIMIRPAQRKEKERKKEIDQMRAGTKVLFGGGIVGVITEVKEATFSVKIADGVVIEIARGAVQRIMTDDKITAADSTR